MKHALTTIAIFGLGLALGRLFDAAPPKAEAGGGKPLLPPCQDLNGDGSSDVTDAVFFLSWLFLGGPEPACAAGNGPAGVPDTGQTVCYGFDEDRGWGPLACEGVICSGQDGAYATGCPMAGRFADNGDGTVTDNCTGLMWQKNTADVNGDAQSTEQDSVTWCAALEYCESLNFAGHDDWRLPNARELQSIVNYGRSRPATDPLFGPNPAGHWSSTTVAFQPGRIWAVALGSGSTIDGDAGAGLLYVLAVRGGR